MEDTKETQHRLFYSKQDKKLFYIPSYYTHGTGLLTHLVSNLKKGEEIIKAFAPDGEIYCREITDSSRYKSMWYFCVSLEECPKEAFELGDEWTMHAWITR